MIEVKKVIFSYFSDKIILFYILFYIILLILQKCI